MSERGGYHDSNGGGYHDSNGYHYDRGSSRDLSADRYSSRSERPGYTDNMRNGEEANNF